MFYMQDDFFMCFDSFLKSELKKKTKKKQDYSQSDEKN
jgi:hypothetical protein